MGKIKVLWELQELDNRERHLRRQLENLPIRREIETLKQKLVERRAALLEITESLRENKRELKRGEGELAANEGQRRELERRLYSGEITSSKELSQIQKKLAQLHVRGEKLEEEVLRLMVRVEELEAEKENLAAGVRDLEAELAQKQLAYEEQVEELELELAGVPVQRDGLVQKIEEEWFNIYCTLSREKGGQAVAAVRGDLCLGCRLALPTNLVSRIIRNDQLQMCPNCGRILYYEGTK